MECVRQKAVDEKKGRKKKKRICNFSYAHHRNKSADCGIEKPFIRNRWGSGWSGKLN